MIEYTGRGISQILILLFSCVTNHNEVPHHISKVTNAYGNVGKLGSLCIIGGNVKFYN
jgi:hypothetical protein